MKSGVKILGKAEVKWPDRLTSILLSIRTTPSTATGKTPSELFLGRKVRTKLTMATMEEDEDEEARITSQRYQERYKKEVTPNQIKPGDRLRVKRPGIHGKMDEKWTTESKIVREVIGPGTVRLEDGSVVNYRRLSKVPKQQQVEKQQERAEVQQEPQRRTSERVKKKPQRLIEEI